MTFALTALAAVLAAPPAAGLAPQPTDAQIRERIEVYLGAIDTPIPATRWRALGPRAVPQLAAIAHSEAEMPTSRATAVEALAALGGAEAEAVAAELARAPQAPFVVRASAIEAVGRLAAGPAVGAALQPLLRGAADPRLRAVAAETLARHGGTDGCAAVRERVGAEPERERGKFRRALSACERK